MPAWGGEVEKEWIKENKKVDIEAIDGGGNAAQRLSTMIAGDTLPDLIWGDKGADVEKLREGGVLEIGRASCRERGEVLVGAWTVVGRRTYTRGIGTASIAAS